MNRTSSQSDPRRRVGTYQTVWLIAGILVILALVGIALFFLAKGGESTEELNTDDLSAESLPESTDAADGSANTGDTTPDDATPSESTVATNESGQPDPTVIPEATPPSTSQPQIEVPPPATNSSRECYSSDGNVLVLDFSEDVETFTGALRIAQGGVTDLFAVGGRRTAGTLFDVNVETVSSGAVELQEWAAGASGMSAGSLADIDAVDCAEITDDLAEIYAAVTAYPEIPQP